MSNGEQKMLQSFFFSNPLFFNECISFIGGKIAWMMGLASSYNFCYFDSGWVQT